MIFGQYKVYSVLTLFAIVSWFMADFFDEEITVETVIVDHSPDYFSVNYYKKEMTKQGLLKNELIADKMTHYADDGRTHLDNPVMTLYNSELPPWVIQSEKGILEADRDHLLLAGQVAITRSRSKKTSAIEINTSDLYVQLSISHAKTKQWAEVIDGANRTEGVGMETVFVDPIKLKFLSKVKGRYVFN